MEFNLISYKRKLFFLIGLFSTLGALIINIGGMDLAVLNIFIALALIIQIASGKFYISKYKIPIILLFLTMIISTFGNSSSLVGNWQSESIKGTIKFVFFLAPFCILYSDKELFEYREVFFKGLKVSAYIQLLWELLQIAFWNIANISINEVVFGQMLGIKIRRSWTFISDERFRPTGVSWEPANLSLALVIGYCLSKNRYSKVLFIVGTILSTSRTGIILISICVLLDLYKYFRGIRKNKDIEFKKVTLILIIIMIIISLCTCLIFSNEIVNYINVLVENIVTTINKLSLSHLMEDSSANVHTMYYLKAPFILFNSNLFNIFFGYGTFVAGYPYSSMLNVYTWQTGWNPESDFITLLMGNGIIGLVLYYLILYKCFKFNRNDFSKLKILASITIAGILYINIRSTWPFYIIMMLFVKDNTGRMSIRNGIKN